MLLGAGLNFFTTGNDSPLAHRLRIFGIGSLLISAAIYSVALPLYYVLRKGEPAR